MSDGEKIFILCKIGSTNKGGLKIENITDLFI